MSERASQTAQRYVDAMNIASAKIEQLQAEVEALREQVRALESHRACGMPYDQCRFSEDDRRALDGDA